MTRRGILIRLALLAGAGAGAFWLRENVLWAPPRIAFPDGRPTGWLGFDQPDISPTVPVRIGQRTVTALIDSGAQRSVIDRAVFDTLGLDHTFDIPSIALGVDGRPRIGRGVTMDARIGPLDVKELKAAILDMGPLASANAANIGLVLGQDFLKAAALELEPASHRLRLHPPGGPAPTGDGVFALPLRPVRWGLATDVTVEGHTFPALVDTGASALLSIRRSAAEEAGLMDGREQRPTSSLILGGETHAVVVRAASVIAAGRAWGPTETAVYDNAGPLGPPQALLGMAAFQDAVVWLDFAGRQLMVSRIPTVDLGLPVRAR